MLKVMMDRHACCNCLPDAAQVFLLQDSAMPARYRCVLTWQVPVWRVSWSITGNILAVSDGKDNVTLWKEAVDGQWQQISA